MVPLSSSMAVRFKGLGSVSASWYTGSNVVCVPPSAFLIMALAIVRVASADLASGVPLR